MTNELDMFTEPETTQEEILSATYETLSKYGYAELTIARIGDEFDKSPSLIYHHYDDKDALILDCLEYMLKHFEASLVDSNIEEPTAALTDFLEVGLRSNSGAPDQFIRTLIELRARTSHDGFNEHFSRSDRVFQDYLETVIKEGIDSGEFEVCDPDNVATVLFTTLSGALYRRSTCDSQEWVAPFQEEISHYLELRLGLNNPF